MSREAIPSKLAWMLAGGVVGALLTQPVEHGTAKAWNAYCGTEERMSRAHALRKKAIAARDSEQHRQANALYSEAYNCGLADALAELATAYCLGLGIPKDRGKGLKLFREASSNRRSIAIERLLKLEKYCPTDKSG